MSAERIVKARRRRVTPTYGADGVQLDDGRRKVMKVEPTFAEQIVMNARRRGIDTSSFEAKLAQLDDEQQDGES